VVINEQGDTLVTMTYHDAKILLEDVLHYEYADSLLAEYKVRDSLNTDIFEMHKDVLMKMGEEKSNLEEIISNFDSIVSNKDEELGLKDDIIKQQKKEIRKQKFLKIIGYTGSVVLPILVLIVLI
jgi:hypothetical protein